MGGAEVGEVEVEAVCLEAEDPGAGILHRHSTGKYFDLTIIHYTLYSLIFFKIPESFLRFLIFKYNLDSDLVWYT